MTRRERIALPSETKVFGLSDWEEWVDQIARALYGLSGAEFEAAWTAGKPMPPSAADLSSIVELVQRLRRNAHRTHLRS